jgi:hypothetical protein
MGAALPLGGNTRCTFEHACVPFAGPITASTAPSSVGAGAAKVGRPERREPWKREPLHGAHWVSARVEAAADEQLTGRQDEHRRVRAPGRERPDDRRLRRVVRVDRLDLRHESPRLRHPPHEQRTTIRQHDPRVLLALPGHQNDRAGRRRSAGGVDGRRLLHLALVRRVLSTGDECARSERRHGRVVSRRRHPARELRDEPGPEVDDERWNRPADEHRVRRVEHPERRPCVAVDVDGEREVARTALWKEEHLEVAARGDERSTGPRPCIGDGANDDLTRVGRELREGETGVAEGDGLGRVARGLEVAEPGVGHGRPPRVAAGQGDVDLHRLVDDDRARGAGCGERAEREHT